MQPGTNIGVQPVVNLADVITAAAQSTLGVLSLIVLGVGFIAYQFFGKSNDRIKLVVFVLIFAAAVGFGGAVLHETKKVQAAPPPQPASSSSPAVEPTSSATPSPTTAPAARASGEPERSSQPATADEPPSSEQESKPRTTTAPTEAPPFGSLKYEYVAVSSKSFKVIVHNNYNREAVVKMAEISCPAAGTGEKTIWSFSRLLVDALPAIAQHKAQLLTMPVESSVPSAGAGRSNDECKVYMEIYVADAGLKWTEIRVPGDDIATAQ